MAVGWLAIGNLTAAVLLYFTNFPLESSYIQKSKNEPRKGKAHALRIGRTFVRSGRQDLLTVIGSQLLWLDCLQHLPHRGFSENAPTLQRKHGSLKAPVF